MTKLISLILVLCILFSLAACGEQKALSGDPAAAQAAAPAVAVLAAPVLPDGDGAAAEADLAGLDAFIAATLSPMFSDLDGQNLVYSPLNVYMALAMLAEVTDGDTRGQITALLGRSDIDALREEIAALWLASYSSGEGDELTQPATVLPAASFWLQDGVEYHTDALNALAEHYYASAFSGPMGSPEYDQQLRDWINEHTNHLLEEQANGLSLDSETLLALVSTLYFKANWLESFNASATADDVFHAASGDETAAFMHRTGSMLYYRGERFAAVYLPMNSGTGMWLLLPDEGVSVEELASDDEALRFLSSEDKNELCKQAQVKLSVPKFDVSSDVDLVAMLASLGIKDVFDPNVSNFKPLTELEGIAVTDIEHAARVKIDEEGCEAAAYTAIIAKGASFIGEQEIIEFTCDRPFFFAVTAQAGQMLFAGAVNTVASK